MRNTEGCERCERVSLRLLSEREQWAEAAEVGDDTGRVHGDSSVAKTTKAMRDVRG